MKGDVLYNPHQAVVAPYSTGPYIGVSIRGLSVSTGPDYHPTFRTGRSWAFAELNYFLGGFRSVLVRRT